MTDTGQEDESQVIRGEGFEITDHFTISDEVAGKLTLGRGLIRHDEELDGWVCQECGHGQEPWDCDLALAILRKIVAQDGIFWGHDFTIDDPIPEMTCVDSGWVDITPEEFALLQALRAVP